MKFSECQTVYAVVKECSYIVTFFRVVQGKYVYFKDGFHSVVTKADGWGTEIIVEEGLLFDLELPAYDVAMAMNKDIKDSLERKMAWQAVERSKLCSLYSDKKEK